MNVLALRRWAAVLLTMCLGWPPMAQAQARYEAQPVLKAQNLVPAALLSGPHFRVDEQVPTSDYLARFTIRSDFGVIEAHGREMLATRVAEIAALAQLAGMSKTDEFLKAAGNAAARPVKAGVNIVLHPVETAAGTPAAVGRLFDRIGLGAERVVEAATDAGKTSEQRAAAVSQRVGGITADVLGYEQERRRLARQLGVDPYTTNAVLARHLDDMAWVMFSGRLGVNTLTAVVVPFSMALTMTSATNDLVWDTPPADLIERSKQSLLAMGTGEAQVQALVRNPWFSLTVLTSLVTGLERLDGVRGRDAVVGFAATARSENQARIIAGAVQMLARQHATEPLVELSAPGPLMGRTRRGVSVAAAPLDYVAWTERVATFARRPELKNASLTLWISGAFSPWAKRELAAAGCTVRENPDQVKARWRPGTSDGEAWESAQQAGTPPHDIVPTPRARAPWREEPAQKRQLRLAARKNDLTLG
jgi:hypothetical protein